MRVLLTGACGFVGSHIAEALLERGDQVIGLDNLSTGTSRNIVPGLSVLVGDVAELAGRRGVAEVDAIVHAAAYADLRANWNNEAERDRIMRENLTITRALLEHTAPGTTLVFISSASVYGSQTGEKGRPLTEGDALPSTCESPYAAAKLGCEALVAAYALARGYRWRIGRLVNVVGARTAHGVIADFVQMLRDKGKIHAKDDGSQRKSWVHVKDVAGAVVALLDERVENGTYNITSAERISWWDIVDELGIDRGSVSYEKRRGGAIGDPIDLHLSGEKLAKYFTPSRSVRAGIHDALDSLGWTRLRRRAEVRMMPTFALGIPHTPWRPERVESLARLLGELGLERLPGYGVNGLSWNTLKSTLHAPRIFDEKAHFSAWSEQVWRWAVETTATHFLQLQDDVLVAPDFWRALEMMVAAVPDQVIGLEVAHPAAAALAREGHRWFTTSDGLVGVGYVMPRTLLAEFLEWRANALEAGAIERVTEDTLVGLWCLATGRKVWHPTPTIIDHDTSLASTYAELGNNTHANRRPLVTWQAYGDDIAHDHFWWVRDEVPHLGCFYDSSPATAYEIVKGFDETAFARAKRDDGNGEKRKLVHLERARRPIDPNRPRVLVCTPVKGQTHPLYNATIWRAQIDESIELLSPWELLGAWQWSDDVVRVRSRFVRAFLETDATHLWFLDADVSCDPLTLRRMLATNRDFVCAPYPKREGVDFVRVGAAAEKLAADDVPLEAAAYKYSIKFLGGRDAKSFSVEADGCAEIETIGLGCALIKREVLERMVKYYRSVPFDAKGHAERFIANRPGLTRENLCDDLASLLASVHNEAQRTPSLEFDDIIDGAPHPTTALFHLLLRNRELLSEDQSICERWRAMGGKVHMYLGPGAPVDHVGEHVHRGHIEALGLKRGAA